MITEKKALEIVNSVADAYEFEKISDLSKAQFIEILAKSIYQLVPDDLAIVEVITNELRRESR